MIRIAWRRLFAAVGLLAGLCRPLTVWACPNCYAASSPRVISMYWLSAFVLSLLPFVIVATTVTVGVRMTRRLTVYPSHPDAERPVPTDGA